MYIEARSRNHSCRGKERNIKKFCGCVCRLPGHGSCCIVLYCVYCIVLYCIVLYCIVCIVLYCIVLYCQL